MVEITQPGIFRPERSIYERGIRVSLDRNSMKANRWVGDHWCVRLETAGWAGEQGEGGSQEDVPQISVLAIRRILLENSSYFSVYFRRLPSSSFHFFLQVDSLEIYITLGRRITTYTTQIDRSYDYKKEFINAYEELF
jgi:hypothetical protein